MPQYPASGVLFQNDRKTKDNQPDYTGTMEFDPEVVRDLYTQMQNGSDKPKARLAGWKKVSKGGKPFVSLRASVEKEQSQGRSYGGEPNDAIPF